MEFAIVLPILALLLLGIIQFAFIFAAADRRHECGARGRSHRRRDAAVNELRRATSIAPNIYTSLTNATDGLLKQNVFAFDSVEHRDVGSLGYPGLLPRRARGSLGRVHGLRQGRGHLPASPLHSALSGLLDGIDGVSDGGLQITASEEMRVENEQLLAAPTPAISMCYNP